MKSFWYFWCPFQFKVFHFSWYRYCFRLLDGNILTEHLVKSLETFCLYTKVERLLVFILTCTFTCKLINSKDSLISDPLHFHLHSCHENSKHTSTPVLLNNWLIVDDDNNSDYVHSPIDLSYQCWFINLKLQLKDFYLIAQNRRYPTRDLHWASTVIEIVMEFSLVQLMTDESCTSKTSHFASNRNISFGFNPIWK